MAVTKTAVKKAAPKVKAAKKTAKPKSATATILKMQRPSMMSQLGPVMTAGARLPHRLQLLIDRQDIQDVFANYCRALDRADENLLRSVFQPDATLDFGPGMFQGTASDFVHWMMGVVAGIKSSHHSLAQSRVDVRDDVAFAETTFTAQFRADKPTGREDIFIAGRYLDRMERRPEGPGGVWKIMHRKQIMDWVRTEPVADIFYAYNPDALWGGRTKNDPSLHMENFPGSQNSGRLPAFLGRHYDSKSIKF
jgi:SnoaL-like domain